MATLEKLQSHLEALIYQRTTILAAGLVLQNCWLVQVKPGGTARTNAKYWQVRSRQPIFGGKTLKHLKPEEVEIYQAAIARGRELKQLDRQIDKLQQQLAQQITTVNSQDLLARASALNIPASQGTPTPPAESENEAIHLSKVNSLAEQERLVKELIGNSQALRELLQQRAIDNQQLRAGAIGLSKALRRSLESR